MASTKKKKRSHTNLPSTPPSVIGWHVRDLPVTTTAADLSQAFTIGLATSIPLNLEIDLRIRSGPGFAFVALKNTPEIIESLGPTFDTTLLAQGLTLTLPQSSSSSSSLSSDIKLSSQNCSSFTHTCPIKRRRPPKHERLAEHARRKQEKKLRLAPKPSLWRPDLWDRFPSRERFITKHTF